MTAGSLTPSENHSDACPWKRFIFCDPVVVDGAVVIIFMDVIEILISIMKW
jgi:hypothetical protein